VSEGLAFEGVFAVEEEGLVEAEATGVEEVLALGGSCLLAGALDFLLVVASSSSCSCLALCLSMRRSAIILT
jgi:hypothetical protein